MMSDAGENTVLTVLGRCEIAKALPPESTEEWVRMMSSACEAASELAAPDLRFKAFAAIDKELQRRDSTLQARRPACA